MLTTLYTCLVVVMMSDGEQCKSENLCMNANFHKAYYNKNFIINTIYVYSLYSKFITALLTWQ